MESIFACRSYSREGINVHKGILLQEIFPHHASCFQGDLILGGKGILADKLNDLIRG